MRTIPAGPERTVEKWFAHERLGVSVYMCRCWTHEDDAWYVLVNNVTEKTTAYALECLRAVLDEQPWADVDVLSCWSDGPAQFKSKQYLGAIVNNFQWKYKLQKTEVHYGAPKHWKGEWDAKIGNLGTAFTSAAAERELTTVEDVVEVYRQWAARLMDQIPDGPRIEVRHFVPIEKSTVQHSKFALRSLFGLKNSFSYSFTVNDRRVWNRASFRGTRGHLLSTLTAITARNHVLSNMPCAPDKLCHPELDDGIEDESEEGGGGGVARRA